MKAERIRNIAIIAHVDHGKTTLVDQLLRSSGTIRENQQVDERVMDSMDLEKEKGITIKAKNTSIHWQNNTVNIVDTPGHADFGAEVERVMQMVDGVLLLVDAFDGPQAQTRFVLRKAIAHGLQPIVFINKVDRPNSRSHWVHDEVLELLLELDASEEQFNATFLYGSARDGWCATTPEGEQEPMTLLLSRILEYLPAPKIEEGTFRMLVSNIDYNDFVGRIAIGRVLSGSVKLGDRLNALRRDGSSENFKVTRVFEYSGLQSKDTAEGIAGNIVGLSGCEEILIGDTLAFNAEAERLPFAEIDPATIQMEFAVNNGPLAGRDGKKVTSRQIRERLQREMKSNISLKVRDTEDGTRFEVTARGAMQIAVLVEEMRREGYELLVSRPTVIIKETENGKMEPFETVYVEVLEEYLGSILENLARRKAAIRNLEHHQHGVTVTANMPTRGLIGFSFDLMNMTSGTGVFSHLFDEYRPMTGEIASRLSGTLVSMENGKAMAYTLDTLQERGKLFIEPGEEIYVGMIVGENPRKHDLPVNPTKAKQLDNMRSSGEGKGIQLSPPVRFSLERAIEYIEADEYVEAPPHHLRLRKRVLDPNERKREEKRIES